MSSHSLLNPEKTAIFNSKVATIENFAARKYAHSPYREEISQAMLLGYAIALEKANLLDNYESYCWQAMKWSAKVHIRLNYIKEANNIPFTDFIGDQALTSRVHDCNSRLRQSLMIEQIRKVYEKLGETEQSIVSAEFDVKNEENDNQFSYDKRKRIVRKFKHAVMSQIMDS